MSADGTEPAFGFPLPSRGRGACDGGRPRPRRGGGRRRSCSGGGDSGGRGVTGDGRGNARVGCRCCVGRFGLSGGGRFNVCCCRCRCCCCCVRSGDLGLWVGDTSARTKLDHVQRAFLARDEVAAREEHDLPRGGEAEEAFGGGLVFEDVLCCRGSGGRRVGVCVGRGDSRVRGGGSEAVDFVEVERMRTNLIWRVSSKQGMNRS